MLKRIPVQWRRNRGGARGALAHVVFSGKILIIKEKFRVFLENLGIRGKICNILFKKCRSGKFFLLYVRKKFFLYVRKKFFQRLFVYVRKNFLVYIRKKMATGGRKF